MLRLLTISFFALIALKSAAQINYDSLNLVLEKSENKADFAYVDSIIRDTKTEYNTLALKNLIYTATERTKLLGFELLHAGFLFRESLIETIQGNYGNGMRLAKEALVLFAKHNSIHASACYNSIGGLVCYEGDYETAIEYLHKAFAIGELFPDSPHYKENLCNNNLMLGNIYITMGDFDQGEYYCKLALDIAGQEHYISTEIYACLNLSKISRKRNNYDEAFAYLEQALESSKANSAYNLEALTEVKIAETYNELGNYDAALVNYENAEKLALRQNLSDWLLKTYKGIYQLHASKGNLVEASNYQQKYIDLFEIRKKIEKEEEVHLLQVKFKLNEKNAQIRSLAVEKNHEQERNRLLQVAITVAITGIILLVIIIFLSLNRLRLRRKINLERQEKDLSMYQLTALKSQMNPHFTFNALNSIQDLILKEKTEESYTYISKFAHLMRQTLQHSDKDFISISDELAAITLYLELEQLRFQGDLKVDFETNGIKDISIPPLLIQPFIENAIKHGLLHKKGPKHIHVDFKLKDHLVCTIRDNGIGRKAAQEIQQRRAQSHTSFAQKSIEDRFKLLRKIYGKSIGVTYIDVESDSVSAGTTIILSMPYKNEN